MFNNIILHFCLFVGLFSIPLESCSTFLLEKNGQFLVAKSYDWISEKGLVITNKRNIAKTAITTNHPMQWISKYGSIVFTQAGREFPMSGMNETGLVIELMWLANTTYPAPDSRPTIEEVQWIQYQLDTASSIEEVLASDRVLRIDSEARSLLHFMVVDKTGNCAVIEFIDGQLVVHKRNEMLAPVLTNSPYEKSVAFLKEFQGFGGARTPQEGFTSLERFVRLASLIKQFGSSNSDLNVLAAFNVLSSVANFEESFDELATFGNMAKLVRSRWNIVYDVAKKQIHFLTKNHSQIRTIQMGAFNFEGNTDVQVLTMQTDQTGSVNAYFIPYTYEINRQLIDHFFSETPFLRDIPEEIREQIARYPESCHYVEELILK